EPLEARQRDGFTHQGRHLVFAGALAQDFEREPLAGGAVLDGPDLTTSTGPESAQCLVASWKCQRVVHRIVASEAKVEAHAKERPRQHEASVQARRDLARKLVAEPDVGRDPREDERAGTAVC